jgi:AcrR family transcriptional regulator
VVTQLNGEDPRVKRTRQLIVQAFIELLAEKSFRAISVQDVAERATVNRATFYAHFEDKYALMDHFIRNGFQQALTSQLPASFPFTLDNLHLLTRTVLEHLAQYHGRCKAADKQQVEPIIEATIQNELYKFILNWLRHAPPPDHQCQATIDTAAMVMSWAIFGVGLQWSSGPRTVSAEQMANQIVAVLTRGLSEGVRMPA